ncbi:MAG: FtsQ-type POTRA domain-containing protein [Alphaproteobacteria bacterium]|jgi:cell division protein FtsQ|nr:FtsQ-type POTRA domain-containing protein [Alphaproteobacteria bacterium]
MSKVKGKSTRKAQAEPTYFEDGTQASSVIFGIVMVIAIIVAGAAMLGGSLSQASQRWANVMDGSSRALGLSVESVEVIGLEHVPVIARQVEAAAMIAPGENMFRADPHVIRRRIEDTQLVANVQVYRLWPDSVMIYADAAQPTALWYDGEKWAVVDSLGRVMPRQKAADHAHLVKSVGPGAPGALPVLEAALSQMPDLSGQVKLARRIAERRWNLELVSGAVVELPSDEKLAAGMASLARFEARGALSRRALAKIDLRVPGRVFLTRAEGTPEAEEAA